MRSLSFTHEVSPDKSSGVLVVLDGRRCFCLGWKKALEACQALDAQLRNIVKQVASPVVRVLGETSTGDYRGNAIQFRQDEFAGRHCILVLANGKLCWDMPTEPVDDGPSIARQIWSEWLRVSRIAEEWAKREQVSRDAAILHRSGAPFGIATHPAIRREAASRAEHDRDLRRFMPDGIKSAEAMGPPGVFIDNRPPAEVLRSRLPGMGKTDRAALVAALKESTP